MIKIFHQEYYNWKILQTEEEVRELAEKMKASSTIYYDTETSGLRVRHEGEDYMVGLTVAVDDEIDETVYYLPLRHVFEGEFDTGRIILEDLGLRPSDFPDFNPEMLAGEWYNLDYGSTMEIMRGVFEGGTAPRAKKQRIVADNIMFDLHVLACEGVDIEKLFEHFNIFDTMVAIHTFDEEAEKKLETVVKNSYGVHKVDFSLVRRTVSKEEKKSVGLKASQNACFQHIQIPIGGVYSIEDVWFMKQMVDDLIEAMKNDEQLDNFYDYRMPFVPVLWRMERRGMKVSVERCKAMAEKAEKELEKLSYRIYELCGVEFNINSGQQLAEILFGFRKTLKDKKTGDYSIKGNDHIINNAFAFTPVSWTDGGKEKDKKLKMPQTNAEVLEELLSQEIPKKGKSAPSQLARERTEHEGREVVTLLLKFAKLEKLYSSFMIGLLEQLYSDGKAHPSFNICGTDSWRLSCDSPNLN